MKMHQKTEDEESNIMESIQSVKSDSRPLYQRAISALRRFISENNLMVGDQLPSEGELAEKLGISRSTLRRALSQLEVHGLISRQQGRGTFLTHEADTGFVGGLERLETFRSLAQKAGYQPSVIERRVSRETVSHEISLLIGVDSSTPMIRVESVEAVSGRPCIYLDDYIPQTLVNADDLSTYEGSVLDYALERDEEPISFSRCEIFAIAARDRIAKKLRIEEGAPLLHFVQTHFARSGTPVGVTLTYILTERFNFYMIRKG